MQSFLNTGFAARNGFSGFKSYFEAIFNPEEYEYMAIIKGGPGTGKSTLMKSLASSFENVFSTERILCSSDKNSLDGLIIKNAERKIAILDGTSPHLYDPILPGCVEEIINLCEYWIRSSLQEERLKITDLTKNKKAAYKRAYSYLSECGKELFLQLKECENSYFEDLMLGRKIDARIVSSFSKDGYYRIESERFWKKRIALSSCEPTRASSYLKNLILERNCKDLTVFISPFDERIIEGFYDKSSGELYIYELSQTDKKSENTLYSNENLALAKEEFKTASSLHFELEKIYTKAMDFEKIEECRQKLLKNIENALK
jgi:hypothetical protein